jgi:photosystem II stability/assembly factor-like uncharacterized protein
MFRTTDGGASWVEVSLPPAEMDVRGVTCPTTTDCFAVGDKSSGTTQFGNILATTEGGTTWTDQFDYTLGLDPVIEAVECTSATSCIAVGGTTGTPHVGPRGPFPDNTTPQPGPANDPHLPRSNP